VQKILSIVESIAHEKNISYESAIEAFREALLSTAKRLEGSNSYFEIEIDQENMDFHIYKILTVVDDDDDRAFDEPEKYIYVEDAKEYGDGIEAGDQVKMEIHLDEYGRTGASNLFRELEYHIQRRIEQDLFKKYKDRVGYIIIGTVVRVDDEGKTYVEIGELKGILDQRNRIKGESFKIGDTIKSLLRYVKIDPKQGMSLELTRTSPKFLEELMKREVPELQDGAIEIVSSARIPGERAKVALKSDRADIDPVGSAVGQKGVRINAVSKELNGENIDCIEYSPIPEIFISRALAPAVVKSIKIVNKDTDEQKAVVDITADQKAKAIGKSGINIRLASMLTKYQIELNEVEGVVSRTPSSSTIEEKHSDISALESLFK
jgi:N utilization substance protein A